MFLRESQSSVDAAALRGLSTHISVHSAVGTVCRKPRHFTGAKATCLGDTEITWENLPLDLDLDYCLYWGIPYRQNNSHEDPDSVQKFLLKLPPSEHFQCLSSEKSQSLSRDSPLCEAMILTTFHGFQICQSATQRSLRQAFLGSHGSATWCLKQNL